MTTFDSAASLAHESNSEFDAIVKPLIPYIYTLARKYVSRTSDPVELWYMNVDEVVQITLIQLWHASQHTSIANFKAYARRIVHNEAVNLVRRCKREPVQRLQTEEDGEWYLGSQIHPRSLDGVSDPQEIVEQQEQEFELLSRVGDAVSNLPTCQKEAVICDLKGKIDNLLGLVDVFRMRGLHIEEMDWPSGKQEKQRRKASVSPARRKLAEALENGIDW